MITLDFTRILQDSQGELFVQFHRWRSWESQPLAHHQQHGEGDTIEVSQELQLCPSPLSVAVNEDLKSCPKYDFTSPWSKEIQAGQHLKILLILGHLGGSVGWASNCGSSCDLGVHEFKPCIRLLRAHFGSSVLLSQPLPCWGSLCQKNKH